MIRIARWAVLAVLLTAALAGSARAAGSADTSRVARLAEYADRLAAFGFSGQLLVAEHGVVVLERASGWADRRFHVPMTTGTQLAAGSVTKDFVSAAVLRLQAQHRLRVTDRLAERLPGVPADKTTITLEQLLSHTAGLAPDLPDGLDDEARDELVRAVLAQPLAAAPGDSFLYSNAAFDLLAAVVERVSGTTFDAFVRRELLAPAGLERTGIAGAPGCPVLAPSCGYEGGRRVSAWREWPAGWTGTGSGRLVTTARDLWRWAEALRSGRLLGADGWADMTTRRARAGEGVGYGLGLWLRERPAGASAIVIGGEVTGFRALCRIEPDVDRVIVVLTNDDRTGDGRERQVIADALVRLASGKEAAQPPPVQRAAAASSRELEGAWAMDGGGRVEVWEENGQLWLGARGQPAVDLFAPDDSTAIARRHGAERRTLTLIRAVTQQDSAAARAAFPPAEFALGFPLLTQRLRALLAAFGDLQRIEGLGAVESTPGAGLRDQFRLTFLDHVTDVTLGYADDQLREVSVGDGRPFPVLLPVAQLADGDHAAYDVTAAHLTRLRVEPGSDGAVRLAITTSAGERSATRIR